MRTYFKLVPILASLTACGGGSSDPVEALQQSIVEEPVFSSPLTSYSCEPRYDPAVRASDLLSTIQGVRTGASSKTLEECIITQMSEPTPCPTTPTDTDDSRYKYITCDGVLQRTDISFPYDRTNTEKAIIDILAVVDTKLTSEDRGGLSVGAYIQRELDFANSVFEDSGVYILLRLADIEPVEVAPGDLRRQYGSFFNSRNEFSALDSWQATAQADIAFLFKKLEEDPIACGVASIDGTRGLSRSRGITQCYQNTVFQNSDITRYYERAHETFVHEIGHILGLEHHFPEASATSNIFKYSFGYLIPGYEKNPDSVQWGGYGTIMSYSDLPTGRFSTTSENFIIPETGQSKQLGTNGGCFCMLPEEEKAPPTESVEHLNRVRYVMSQLSEQEHNIEFFLEREEDLDVCLY